MLKLHPFQQKAIEDLRMGYLRGLRRQILSIPTGGGKTVVASDIIRSGANKGTRSLFLVDRIVLVEQAERHLENMGLKVGIMQGENTWLRPDDQVVVASIQTIGKRGPPEDIGLVVIDEAHSLHKTHIGLMEFWDDLPFIGLSATPLRADLGQYFTNLVRGPSVGDLMDKGYLVRPTTYCPSQDDMQGLLADVRVRAGDFVEKDLTAKLNTKELVGDILANWRRQAAGLKTIAFCVDVAHSRAVCDDFLGAGVLAEQLDYTTDGAERNAIIERFRNGETTVITSVNVLGVGFDVPDAVCAILARPTLSEALYIQQAGRILRRATGKKQAIILDHAGNTLRFGLPQHFRVPDLGRGDHRSRKRFQRDPKVLLCASCEAAIEPGQQVCPGCGIDRPARAADVIYIDADLRAHGDTATATRTYSPTKRERWYRMAKWFAERNGRKLGWAFHAYNRMFNGDRPPNDWCELPAIEPPDDVARWLRGHDQYTRIRYSKRRAKALRNTSPAGP